MPVTVRCKGCGRLVAHIEKVEGAYKLTIYFEQFSAAVHTLRKLSYCPQCRRRLKWEEAEIDVRPASTP